MFSYSDIVFTSSNFGSFCVVVVLSCFLDIIFGKGFNKISFFSNVVFVAIFYIGFGFYETHKANAGYDYCQIHQDQGFKMVGTKCVVGTPVGNVEYDYKQ